MDKIGRRGLLQLFGVGAIVAPIVHGQPDLSTPVKLVEEAKFEPIALQPNPLLIGQLANQKLKYRIVVDVLTEDNVHSRFSADSFTMSYRQEPVALNSAGYRDGYLRGFRLNPPTVEWELKGRCIEKANGNFCEVTAYDGLEGWNQPR